MNQTVAQRIARARTCLIDVRAGRVSHADEGPEAVILSLSGYLGDMIEILDGLYLEDPPPGSEQARRRDALLALVPASQRAAGDPAGDHAEAVAHVLSALPGDDILAVTRWLRAARREAPALAALGELADWMDGKLDNENADRQWIAETALARIRDISAGEGEPR